MKDGEVYKSRWTRKQETSRAKNLLDAKVSLREVAVEGANGQKRN